MRTALAGVQLTSLDAARQQLGLDRPVGARSIAEALLPPAALQFRLRYFLEHESTDSAAQGAGDEVYIGAIGTDSSSVTIGPDREPVVELIHAPHVGDASANEVRDRWRSDPHVLVHFDLRKPGDWPRTYTVTLLVVEHDNGELVDDFDRLNAEVGGQIRQVVVATAAAAVGAVAGAVVGSAVPGVGTAVGAAIGALAGAGFDAAVAEIRTGLADEIFTPIPLTMTVAQPWLTSAAGGTEVELVQPVHEHGASYEIRYDWHVVR